MANPETGWRIHKRLVPRSLENALANTPLRHATDYLVVTYDAQNPDSNGAMSMMAGNPLVLGICLAETLFSMSHLVENLAVQDDQTAADVTAWLRGVAMVAGRTPDHLRAMRFVVDAVSAVLDACESEE